MDTRRTHLHTFYGTDTYANRESKVYLSYTVDKESGETSVTKNHYEVDFIENDEVKETREMITKEPDVVIHSEQYAEDAAENWVLGVIE